MTTALIFLCFYIALVVSAPTESTNETLNEMDRFNGAEIDRIVNGIVMGQDDQRAVQMSNELSEPLNIDCGSDIEDLGTLVLRPGHRILWSFPIAEHTWYECEINASGGRAKIFEIFPGPKKIGLKKKRLEWTVRADGIYEGSMQYKRDIHGNKILLRPRKWHRWDSD